MTPKLNSDIIVDVIEATIRVLVNTGLTRDEALQVMLSQIAVQVSPDVMQIATKLFWQYSIPKNKSCVENLWKFELYEKNQKMQLATNFLRHNSVPQKEIMFEKSMEFRVLRTI